MSQIQLPIYSKTHRPCSEPFLTIGKLAEQIPHLKSRAVRHLVASQAIQKMLSALRGGNGN